VTEPTLDDLVAELESAAARLRAGKLDADEAAGLVERCAELAGEVGAELERQGRAGRRDDADEAASGQERLL
jgi:hypothetical protein